MIRRSRDFELLLEIHNDEFISPPQPSQRNWILQRSLDEFVDDLKRIDEQSKRFVAGSVRPPMNAKLEASHTAYNGSQLVIDGQQVMQDWERPLMKAMADIVTELHGDVLEVGFGMGISATYIQNRGVNSHTIIECNDEVIRAFERWKREFPDSDIRLIHGKWQEKSDQLASYDGVFFDTYPLSEDEFQKYVIEGITFAEHFFPVAANCLRPGGIFTYYTNEIDSFARRHQRLVLKYFSSFTLTVVKPLYPPKDCNYWWADSMVAVKAVK